NATVAKGQGVGTIVDDDALPKLSIADISKNEGNSPMPATFKVTLSPASGRTVTVDYATADGTAVAGNDYLSTSGTLTFAPGETSKAIVVTIVGDTIKERNETFVVKLSRAVGATISRAQGQCTIKNDDH